MTEPAVTRLPFWRIRDWVIARRALLGWIALSRLVVFGAAFAVSRFHRLGYFGPKLLHDPIALLGSWDGIWYRRVALHGYLLVPGHQSDPAFFPLYPALLIVVHALGLSLVAAGVLLSNVLIAVAIVTLYELGRLLLPEPDAQRAAVFAAIFPIGFVFSMVYPESLVLAAITGAGIAALRDRWTLAAVLVAVAALARPEGVFVVLPLAALAWRRRRGFAVVFAGPLALATFPLYLGWVLGDAGAWGRAERSWGRAFRIGGLHHTVVTLPHALHFNPWLARDVAFVGIYSVLLVAALLARVPPTWVAAAAGIILLPLTSGSIDSVARFGLAAPAVFWGLAWLARPRWIDWPLRFVSLALLAAGTVTLPFIFP